jgi:hypothetical protein
MSFIKTFAMGAIGTVVMASIAHADDHHAHHMDEAPYYNNRPVPCWKIGTCHGDNQARRYLIELSAGVSQGEMEGHLSERSYDSFNYGINGEAALGRHFRLFGEWQGGHGDILNSDVKFYHARAGLQIRGAIGEYWDGHVSLGGIYELRKEVPGEEDSLDSILPAITIGVDKETLTSRISASLAGTTEGDIYLRFHPRWRIGKSTWAGLKTEYGIVEGVYEDAANEDLKERGASILGTVGWRF